MPFRLGRSETAGSSEDQINSALERQYDVHELLAVTRLLNIGDLAAAAVGDPGLGDLAGIDGVVALDVFGTDDAGDDKFAHLVVDADFLPAFDDEISVRQHLRHHCGDVGLQSFLSIDRSLAVRRCGRIRRSRVGREWSG